MIKYYYLLAALTCFVLAILANFIVRKSEAGSLQRLIFEKLLANCLGVTSLILFVMWVLKLLRT